MVLDLKYEIISAIVMSQMQKSSGFVFIATFLIVSSQSFAAPTVTSKGSFRSTKLGLIQQDYSGPKNKSFAFGSPAVGVELTLDSGFSVFRYFFKTRFMVSEGKQNFLNGTTTFNSAYKFQQFAPEVGLSLFPIPRREKGVNVFLWGLGIMSYNNLEIKSIPATSAIQGKDQAFGYGYGAGLGIEYILFSTRTGGRVLIYSEIGFRDERALLVNNTFEIGRAHV